MTKELSPKEVYAGVILEFGIENQKKMLHEEIGELLSALNKYDRGRVNDEAVITEIADVMIMLEQMAFIFGEEEVEAEKERKLQRLLDRLIKHLRNKKKEKENKKTDDREF